MHVEATETEILALLSRALGLAVTSFVLVPPRVGRIYLVEPNNKLSCLVQGARALKTFSEAGISMTGFALADMQGLLQGPFPRPVTRVLDIVAAQAILPLTLEAPFFIFLTEEQLAAYSLTQ